MKKEDLEMLEERILKLIREQRDSLEISTPAKGGGIKVYLDYTDIEGSKKKIDNAIELRKYANEKLAE